MEKRIIVLFFLLVILSSPALASHLPDFAHRRTLTISNPNNVALTDHQVLVRIDTTSIGCNDVRFESDGSLLNYWIEDGTCGQTDTNFWIKIPSIASSSSKTIYMYYGNPSLGAVSNGDTTFEFYTSGVNDAFYPVYSTGASVGFGEYITVRGTCCGQNPGVAVASEYSIPYTLASFVIDAKMNVAYGSGKLGILYEPSCGFGCADPHWLVGSADQFNQEVLESYRGQYNQHYYPWVEHAKKEVFDQVNTWVPVSITRTDTTTTFQWRINGNLVGSAEWGGNGRIVLASDNIGTSSPIVAFDDIRVRKYAAQDPTYSFGSEQSDIIAPLAGISVTPSVNSIQSQFTATDASGISYYEIKFDGAVESQGNHVNSVDTTITKNVAQNTLHSWSILAKDWSGNSRSNSSSKYSLLANPNQPAATPSGNSIYLEASQFNNDQAGSSGYYFDCISSGCHDSAWKKQRNYNDTGLQYNTSYSYMLKYRNGDSVETSSSSAVSVYTNPARPNPILLTSTQNSISFSIEQDQNPADTKYAIKNIDSGNYVQQDGSVGSAKKFLTRQQWASVTMGNLNPAQQYTFSAIAQNGAGIELESSQSSIYTKPNAASLSLGLGSATDTLTISLGGDGNPANVQYAIYDITTGTYLASSGNLGSADPVWQSKSSWNSLGFIGGLEENTEYGIIVDSKNIPGDITSSNTAEKYTRIHAPQGVSFNIGYIDPDEYEMNMQAYPDYTNGPYRIYFEATSSGSNGETNGNVTENYYSDVVSKPNTQYCYRSTAYNAEGVPTSASPSYCVYSHAAPVTGVNIVTNEISQTDQLGLDIFEVGECSTGQSGGRLYLNNDLIVDGCVDVGSAAARFVETVLPSESSLRASSDDYFYTYIGPTGSTARVISPQGSMISVTNRGTYLSGMVAKISMDGRVLSLREAPGCGPKDASNIIVTGSVAGSPVDGTWTIINSNNQLSTAAGIKMFIKGKQYDDVASASETIEECGSGSLSNGIDIYARTWNWHKSGEYHPTSLTSPISTAESPQYWKFFRQV